MNTAAITVQDPAKGRPAVVIRRYAELLGILLIGEAFALAFANALILLFVAPLAIVLALPPVRRHREQAAVRRRRDLENEARRRRLEVAGVPVDTLLELVETIDAVGASDPRAAAWCDFDELLDQYVDRAIAYQRWLEVSRSAHRASLVIRVDAWHRRKLFETKLAWGLECEQRVEALADEVGAIVELVHLYAARATMPDITELVEAPAIETCLERLSTIDVLAGPDRSGGPCELTQPKE